MGLLVVLALLALLLVSPEPEPPPPVPVAADPCAPVPGEQAGQQDGFLRFGSIYPKTGPLSSQGEQLRTATEMAVRDVKAAGPIPGVRNGPVLDVRDEADEAEPGSTAACQAVAAMLASGVEVIAGPSASSSSIRMSPRFVAAGGVVVSPASTSPELSNVDDGGRYFRTAPSDVLQGRILGDVVAIEGGQNVAVVARADAYGRGLSSETVRELRGLDERNVLPLEYEPTVKPEDTDFRAVVDDIRTRPTDAIVVIGFNEVGWLLRELAAADITPRDKNIYAADGFLRDTFPANPVLGGPDLVAGLRGIRPLLDRGFKAKVAAARSGLQDFTFSPHAYDAVVITALAAVAARSENPADFGPKINAVTRSGRPCTTYALCRDLLVKDPMADINYEGVSGPLDFTGDGEPCQGYYSVELYDDAGQLQEYRRAFGNYLCTGPLPLPR